MALKRQDTLIKHASNFFAHCATAVLTGVVVLFGLLALLLARGPISLGYLTPYLQDELNAAVAPFSIRVDSTQLAWEGWDNTLDVRVVGVRLFDPDNNLLAEVPQMSVGLQGEALLVADLVPTSLELIAPQMVLVREADGRVNLGFSAADASRYGDDDPFGRAIRGDSTAFGASLERVSVRDADLTIEDRQSGASLRSSGSNLTASRSAEGVLIEFAGQLDLDGQQAFLGVGALYPADGTRPELNVRVSEMRPAALAAALPLPELAPFRNVDAPVSGTLAAELTPDFAVDRLGFDLTAAAGALRLPDVGLPELRFASLRAVGQAADGLATATLEELQIDLGDGFTARLTAAMSRTDAGLGLRASGDFAGLKVDDLDIYWPPDFEDKARTWVTRNIADGVVNRGHVEIDIRPGELDAEAKRPEMVVLDFDFTGVSATYWSRLPAMTDAIGSARLTMTNFDLTLAEGRVGELALTRGRLGIADLGVKTPPADIEFVATGPAVAALTLLDREPLGFPSALGIQPDSVTGNTATGVRFKFPLSKDLRLADVQFSADSRLTDFGLPEIFGRFAVSAGDLELKVDRAGLDAAGMLALNGVPVSLTWRRDFEQEEGVSVNRYGLAATLDTAQRAALGLAAESYVNGPIDIAMQLSEGPGGRISATGTAELVATEVTVSEFKWRKPAGMPAQLAFAFASGSDGAFSIDRFEMTAPEFEAAGAVRFGRDFVLQQVRLDRIRANGSDLSAEVNVREDGLIDVAAGGARLDLRPYIESLEEGAGELMEKDSLQLRGRFATLIISDELSIADAAADAVRQDGEWQSLVATGRLNDGPAVRWLLIPRNGFRELSVTSSDAGGVVREAGIFDGAVGGEIRLTMTIPENKELPTVGRLQAANFRIVNAPILTRILTLGSWTGIRDLITGEGIQFTRLDAPFELTPAKLTIGDSRAVGPALGLTLSGEIDRPDDVVNLRGTVVPSYTINSVLGRVPLLGDLFVGREGEGVFAATYRVEGDLNQPEVSVNPLSALAPGILRRILEVLQDPAPGDDRAPVLPEEAQHN